jgi:hypothetical protein
MKRVFRQTVLTDGEPDMIALLKTIVAHRASQDGGQGEIHPRGDAYARISGRDYQIRAWSLRGIALAPGATPLVSGQKAQASIVLRDFHDPDGELRISLDIVVESIAPTGLRARWGKMANRDRELMKMYYERKTKRLAAANAR